MTEFECDRCESTFPLGADHTKIVRRNFLSEPRPAKTEYLCPECLSEYERFLQ